MADIFKPQLQGFPVTLDTADMDPFQVLVGLDHGDHQFPHVQVCNGLLIRLMKHWNLIQLSFDKLTQLAQFDKTSHYSTWHR